MKLSLKFSKIEFVNRVDGLDELSELTGDKRFKDLVPFIPRFMVFSGEEEKGNYALAEGFLSARFGSPYPVEEVRISIVFRMRALFSNKWREKLSDSRERISKYDENIRMGYMMYVTYDLARKNAKFHPYRSLAVTN